MQPNPTLIVRWNQTILDVLEIATNDRDPRIALPGVSGRLNLGPPMVARALAMIYTAAFQAWAVYDNTATAPVAGGPPRAVPADRTGANRRIAISYAIYRTALNLFPRPALVALLDAQMADLKLDPGVTTTIGNTPDAIGNAVAAAVIAARASDGANQSGTDAGSPPVPLGTPPVPYVDTTGYAPRNAPAIAFGATNRHNIAEPGLWQPLSYIEPFGNTILTPGFIAPHWNKVAAFALTSADQFLPPLPEKVDSQGFVDQARHVLEVQRGLTVEQKIIAEFWADGPKSWLPPGHWCEIAGTLSGFFAHTLETDVKMFFGMANAIHDAAIATWDAKRHYDYVRPITAIRWLFDGAEIEAWGGPGKGTTTIRGETWRPFQKDTFPTPPFPEYTSGHSAFSAAAAEVLRSVVKTDHAPYSWTVDHPLAADPGIGSFPYTLNWNTLSSMAQSAGESRLFGGIHFWQGNAAGLTLGTAVGKQAWAKAQTFF